jgi:hypothetical protein
VLQNVEFFAGVIVFWVPFYQPLRLAFLIWCMLPIPANGSKIMYDQVIKKFFLTQKAHIDGVEAAAKKAAGAAKAAVAEMTKEE